MTDKIDLSSLSPEQLEHLMNQARARVQSSEEEQKMADNAVNLQRQEIEKSLAEKRKKRDELLCAQEAEIAKDLAKLNFAEHQGLENTDEMIREALGDLIRGLSKASFFTEAQMDSVQGRWTSPSKASQVEMLKDLNNINIDNERLLFDLVSHLPVSEENRKALNVQIQKISDDSRKRQRVLDEIPFRKPKPTVAAKPRRQQIRDGCKCKNPDESNVRLKATQACLRCPCANNGMFCTSSCRCKAEYCANRDDEDWESSTPTVLGSGAIRFPRNKTADAGDDSWEQSD